MANSDLPPGMRYNPSERRHRLLCLILALAGFCVAGYLTLFQTGVIAQVWEPFFGNGSRSILKHSPVAHFLPIPDASLGAAAYLVEAILAAVGSRVRWRTAPWLVLVFGAIAFGLGAFGILLTALQPVFAGTFCTLCLASAACSIAAALAAAPEVIASIGLVRRAPASGRSVWRAVRDGTDRSASC